MAKFSDEFLDEIRQRVSLVSTVAKAVKLTKAGAEQKGLCPFHNEKTPSFTVNEDKGFYHCFGCDAHGDVIGFVMQTQGQDFVTAVKTLAAEAGLSMDSTPPDDVQTSRQKRTEALKGPSAALRGGQGGRKDTSATQTPTGKVPATVPRFKPSGDMTDLAIGWFAKRGISHETLAAARVTSTRAWMPGANKEVDCFAFPFFRGGALVNVKYRDGQKRFRQEKDAEKIFYGLDSVGKHDSIIITEGECFPGDAEVLTPSGWTALAAYKGGEVVQWESGGRLRLVSPVALVEKPYAGPLVRFEVKGWVSETTPGHKLVTMQRNGRLRSWPAGGGSPSTGDLTPRVGVLDGPGIALSNDHLRLAVAVAADAAIDRRKNTGWRKPREARYARMGFKKSKKIKRLRGLLGRLGVAHTDTESGEYTTICFSLPDWVPGRLFPESWLVLATEQQRETLLSELVVWDGNRVRGRDQDEFSTKYYQSARWVQTLAHTSGRCSSIIPRANAWGAWYKVSILHGKSTSSWQRVRRSAREYKGNVYCLQVPSGALLVRQEDKITVSGNCDALSLAEIGLGERHGILSVPDGAPGAVRDGEIDPEHDTKFSYVWNCRDVLEAAKRVILAVDADDPGRALEEELARRIGKEKCWRVTWPEQFDVQMKDANEVLVEMGPEALADAIKAAKPYPIKSLYAAADFDDAVMRLYRDGRERGKSTGFRCLDGLLSVAPGLLYVVTGWPSSGKSLFCDAVFVNLAMNYGQRFALCSFENPPNDHIATLAEKFLGMPFFDGFGAARMGEGDLLRAKRWINEFFCWIRADDESPTIDWVLEKARAAVMRYGINGLVLDPYNEFDHQRPKGVTETEYVSGMLAKVKRFAQAHGVHVWFVAHPSKPEKMEHQHEAPSLLAISGSSHWINKADFGISVRRKWREDGSQSSTCEVNIKKVRWRHLGRTGRAELYFNAATGRYEE